jgi:hypothetical protein
MLGSADYTATSGTTVVLVNGCTVGDLVEVISFQVSSVLNAVQATGTTFSGNVLFASGNGIWNTSGNVGIGTASPAYKLDAQNAGGLSIRAYNTSSTSPAQFRATNTLTTVNSGVDNIGGYLETQGAYPTLFYTNGTERMRIDSSGRVTTPYQPAFLAQYSSGATINSGTTGALAFNSEVYNVGSHYSTSTYRFTAPVAGVYVFYTGVGGTSGQPANSYFGIAFQVNGSTKNAQWQNSAAGYQVQKHTQAFSLNAGDYVTVWCEVASSFTSQAPFFGGYLLG